MSILHLYTGENCHLCEQAYALITAHAPDWQIDKIDIKSDPALYHQYAVRIPVLMRTDRASKPLCWPFSATDLAAYLA